MAESTGLENRRTRKGTVSSNLTPSASFSSINIHLNEKTAGPIMVTGRFSVHRSLLASTRTHMRQRGIWVLRRRTEEGTQALLWPAMIHAPELGSAHFRCGHPMVQLALQKRRTRPKQHRRLAPKFRLPSSCLLRLLEHRALYRLYPSPFGNCIGPSKASFLQGGRLSSVG